MEPGKTQRLEPRLPTLPCELAHIKGELEVMAGTDVNAVLEFSFDEHREPIRTNGRLGLAEEVPGGLATERVRYAVGGKDSWIEICEEEFGRGQMIPGRVRLELTSGVVLNVERRHFPPELEAAA